jgi:excisionase family DNA binding protein
LTLLAKKVIMVENKVRCILEARFMAVEDIARDLNIAEDTVRSWIREKKLPAYRLGKEYRIKIVDYEHFLEQRRTMNDAFKEEN